MDWLWPLLAAPFVGSVLGVLIRRLPRGEAVAVARSRCESCATPLGARDLAPLLSFALLRGRCRHCGAPIAVRHLLIELAALAVAGVAVAVDPGRPAVALWADCAFAWTLLALAWIDWETWLLPDALTLPLIPAGLLVTQALTPEATTDHAGAAVLGYLAFRGIGWLYRRLRGREGLGEGDAKLLAAIGAWVGLLGLSDVILGGALAGIGGALLLAARGRRVGAGTAIPFGPCLALAGVLVRLHPWGG